MPLGGHCSYRVGAGGVPAAPRGAVACLGEALLFPAIHCALRGAQRRPPCCLPSPPHSLFTLTLWEGSLLPPWQRCAFEVGVHGHRRVLLGLLYLWGGGTKMGILASPRGASGVLYAGAPCYPTQGALHLLGRGVGTLLFLKGHPLHRKCPCFAWGGGQSAFCRDRKESLLPSGPSMPPPHGA